MIGSQLAFYVHENHKHRGVLTWQWLLQEAAKLGIGGGTAFVSTAGFGQHHVLHMDRMFGTGLICVKVEFLVTEKEKSLLVELLGREQMDLFCAQSDVRFGMIGEDAAL